MLISRSALMALPCAADEIVEGVCIITYTIGATS